MLQLWFLATGQYVLQLANPLLSMQFHREPQVQGGKSSSLISTVLIFVGKKEAFSSTELSQSCLNAKHNSSWLFKQINYLINYYYIILFVTQKISHISFVIFIHVKLVLKKVHLVVQVKQVGVVFSNVSLCIRD